MSTGMPELGSKISLISKADIRYEGRLFTVDPQECTIALASVRSFGTEDRETQFVVAPQNQVYDYILFRGSDIKDIRVLNNVPTMPNDPAIMQVSVPPTLGGGGGPPPGQFGGQFSHPVVGQAQYPPYHPMGGFPGGVHAQMNKTSELSPQTSVDLPMQPKPIGSGLSHHGNQVKDQGSMLDLIGSGSQQNSSRSGTPGLGHRKSPTADQSTQVGSAAGGSGQRDSRRGSNQPKPQQRNRTNSRNRQRFPSGSGSGQEVPYHHHQQQQQQQNAPQHQQYNNMHNQHNMNNNQQMHNQHQGGYNRGGWRGRSRGRGRGFVPRPHQNNKLKFDKDYDFEQANTEFEELRSQLAKTKISEGEKTEGAPVAEVDKKDDSGNETGAGEPEVEEEVPTYDKNKSFFDNISCEAVERSKGRTVRTDWRKERKLNSETFGMSSARRGQWRPRAAYRPHMGGWRGMGMNRGGNNMLGGTGRGPRPAAPQHQPQQPRQHTPAK